MDWEQYKKDHCSEFDKLVEEMNKEHPQEMEDARQWVKEFFDRAYVKEQKEIPLIITSKTKEACVRELGIEGFKNEVRRGGFNLVCVMDNVSGPVKEEIRL